jgi:hypothetical protein
MDARNVSKRSYRFSICLKLVPYSCKKINAIFLGMAFSFKGREAYKVLKPYRPWLYSFKRTVLNLAIGLGIFNGKR